MFTRAREHFRCNLHASDLLLCGSAENATFSLGDAGLVPAQRLLEWWRERVSNTRYGQIPGRNIRRIEALVRDECGNVRGCRKGIPTSTDNHEFAGLSNQGEDGASAERDHGTRVDDLNMNAVSLWQVSKQAALPGGP